MEEPRDGHSKPDSPLTTFHKDFESFKKAVDRAIERDPYGTLFGRRLQSPPTANNSSWTSFSWIFDPKEIKEESPDSRKPAAPASSNAPSKSSAGPEAIPRTETQSVQSSRIPTSQSAAVDDYEYDPISMRKVPKIKEKAAESPMKATEPKPKLPESPKPSQWHQAEEAEPTRKTFFEALFGEHG
ncbi:MAG: hypothetical protein M1823_007717, partial [Watsoniomyces obsoletus]